jgi:hypothetical protein
MALFFDAAWFDARLAERGLTRATLAAVGGLSEADLELLFKDQRELSPGEVVIFAELLGAARLKSPTAPASRRARRRPIRWRPG